MTPERFGRWATAVGVLFAAFAAWGYLTDEKPLDWLLLNIEVLVRVPFVHRFAYATAMGTAVCLALPWFLPGHMTSYASTVTLRIASALFSFGTALALDHSHAGFIFAVFCLFSGPITGMFFVRILCRLADRWDWLPSPQSLTPTLTEALADVERAKQSVPGPGG